MLALTLMPLRGRFDSRLPRPWVTLRGFTLDPG